MANKTAAIIILVLVSGLILLNACKTTQPEVKAAEQPAADEQKEIPPGTVVQQITNQIKFKVVPPEGSNTSVSI